MTSKPQITARVGEGDNAVTRTAKGRDAWALAELLRAGERGVTPIERPAPRWSHYVYKLRGFGFAIETICPARPIGETSAMPESWSTGTLTSSKPWF